MRNSGPVERTTCTGAHNVYDVRSDCPKSPALKPIEASPAFAVPAVAVFLRDYDGEIAPSPQLKAYFSLSD